MKRKGEKAKMSIVDIHAPAGDGYGVIYADPPWSYRQQGNGAAARHYPTMTPDEIKALPVQTLAAKDCALLMWATFPNLQQALDTIRAWGFEYKTLAFCWIKKNKKSGGGSPIRQHSQKPPEARDRIVQLFGDQRRLELFARESTPGWDAWGNEVQDNDTALL